MPYFMQMGETPRTRHTRFRRPDGVLYREELMGEEGFVSDSSLLYHRETPTDVVAVDAVEGARPSLAANFPLKPRHLRPHELTGKGDLVRDRHVLLGNDDVVMTYSVADEPSPLYRNAIGDELVYIEAGSGRLESVFGTLEVGKGDYVIVPTATTHRWVPADGDALHAVVFEASGHVRPPKRFLSEAGQFLENAPYCEMDLRRPEGPLLAEGTDVEVLVRNRDGVTRYVHATHPFDVVGWFGCLYPYAFNIADFSPVTGSLHRPPPVHQTFEGPGFVICSFVPRLFDYHPDAVPVPPFHANVDSDEVLFYADGSFMSRKGTGIGQGSVSLHPAGFIHGPHPGSIEAALGARRTEETAVMLDTYRPLRLGTAAMDCEDPAYLSSWRVRR
ncbi:homogentisate 1,2-dioxygenase [Streptomyces sp. NPDC057438]|uniref:homogentisate 1,2-dioxygenase n=1 Tax=Streptomyces sp. NPDC057438 TaxID=3346133 RepID=UPI0036C26BFA